MSQSNIGAGAPNPVAEEQFRKGFDLAKSGDIDEAILNVEAALAVSPEEPRYHDLLGTLYAKKGLYEMAVAEWKRSVECDPAHDEVFRRIETAEKMRVQPNSRASQWNWLAIGGLGVLLFLSAAWGTYQFRSRSADSGTREELETLKANLDKDFVPKEKHQELQGRQKKLNERAKAADQKVANLSKKLNEYESGRIYVRRSELKKETEQLNRIRSELAAARQENQRLETELAAVEDASGVQTMAAELQRKEKRVAALSAEYETMNAERNRLEQDVKAVRLDLVKARDHIADLEAQAIGAVSATEATQLRTEVDSLTDKLAKASSGAPTVDAEETLLLYNNALEAVQMIYRGDSKQALDKLRQVEAKAPEGSKLKQTINTIRPKDEQVAEADPEPATDPEPEPTEKAKEAPKPKPTKAKAKPKPTATPRPKAKPKPTAAPVVAKKGPVQAAIPRAIGGGPAPTPRPKPQATPRTQNPPRAQVAAPRPAKSSQKASLQRRKVQLTDQALRLYKQRKFGEANRAIEQAYRIHPTDPRVNQIRNAVRKQLQGGG